MPETRWLAWAWGALGSEGRATEVSRPLGQARVWRLDHRDGAHFLKVYPSRGPGQREVNALRTWGRAVGQIPAVVASDGAALLVTAITGHGVEGGPESPDRVWEAAGRWARRLHELSYRDEDPLPLGEALVRRLDAAAAGAAPWYAAPTLVRDAQAVLTAWTDARVPVHRDYGPHNWLWDAQRGLGVIDFGHARPDAAMIDWLKVPGAWSAAVEVEDARFAGFIRGYGGGVDVPRLRALLVLQGLGTIAWHGRRAEETEVDAARAQLQALG